ncbi:glucuronate isomerase [Paenibacillus arenilitoris]|uniref:Glucuronate isomerase n=1 Tax=Paenibacillus arenilitoris TaxID=2772299 RepID=A0A927CQM6_9BACL|nr:glucuronate isomerase [Paenibacillus arenilitoris]MBD2871959.1 glucuronate isomerase [Paenibacillus arenilitoris]
MSLIENRMTKAEFASRVMAMPVFDTHTHLVGDRLAASDFWEIAHYFWLFRELQAAGYPADADKLPEEERISAFLDAYRATRSTLMNIGFTAILRELYGIEIRDAASVREAVAAVKRSGADEDWAQRTADRLQIRRFAVNHPAHAAFRGMRDDAVLIPRIDGKLGPWIDRVAQSADPARELSQTLDEIEAMLRGFADAGLPGIMTTLPRYESLAGIRSEIGQNSSRDDIMKELLHGICSAAERHGLLVQLFLGVERSWCGTALPANDTARLLKLSALFETYRCRFELVLASELNNLDAVQAAWNFPNVHVGGMWWFNFRASTYRDSMQYRLEALPAGSSSIVVSDARCMEWSFGKIWLVKKLLAEFLWERLESGWIDLETAMHTAEEWLYESAARRYGASRISRMADNGERRG